MLLSFSCKADYDINEVASQVDSTEEHHIEHSEADHEHESPEHEDSELAGSDRHVHAAGVRNHGTAWFFNQPWAADFIWGKMLRDSVILIFLAAAIIFISGYRRKRR